ncbi:MAG: tRNA lysidine(34) synthetase TilS [Clostridia bacterium]|nr:tRNA lysidine(34) synthetase TilS [Clostridia bacterium]
MLSLVKNCIEKHSLLTDGQTVVVGFSGGADSAFLLYALKELGYCPVAVHVEHGIRGSEAQRDALFAERFCSKLNIEFYVEHVNVPEMAKERKCSVETCARNARYEVLFSYAKRFNAPVAVAHNKNDQAETVLMHLFRGSGLQGLCGMEYSSKGVIRPILDLSRQEIEEFNRKNGIEYVTDSTNLVPDYSRNKLRLEIVPQILDFNENALSSITSCASILQEYNRFIKEQTEKLFCKLATVEDGECTLEIYDSENIIFTELVKKAIEAVKGDLVDVEKVHIDSVSALKDKQSGKELHLPHSIRVKRVYNTLIFTKETDVFSAQYEFLPEKEYSWDGKKVYSFFETEMSKEENSEVLDFSTLPEGLTLRTRKSGDFIYPLGTKGKCTLKKYFIDKKIPVSVRNKIPLLAKDNEIYAVLGYTVSEKVKISDKTTSFLKIKLSD